MYEWIDYIDERWSIYSINFEKTLQEQDSRQWLELDEIPSNIELVIQNLCLQIFPFKTISTKLLELILEHSIVSSINSQLIFLTFHFNLYVTNAVYSCFNRLHSSPIYKQLIDEYRILWVSAKKIQFCWKRCISNPNYIICKKRLLQEFNEFSFQTFS